MGWKNDPLEEPWPKAFEWIESHLGGTIVSYERHAWWRPAWFLVVDRDGERTPLYWRGLRREHTNAAPKLEREYRILTTLEAHGIAVPHVYGYCPDPGGILMERVGGKILFENVSDDERKAAGMMYIEQLAKIHRIDLPHFEAIGIEVPADDESVQLSQLDGQERAYRREKRGPDPEIEFILGWLRRNIPQRRDVACLIHWDAGQMRFGRDWVKVMDIETAQIGDPLADLAAMRLRSLDEPMGDLSQAFRHYADITGTEIDKSALNFHTVRFGLGTPIWNAHVVADPPPGIDLPQNYAWYVGCLKYSLEAMAHEMGVTLEHEELPAAAPSRHAPMMLTFISQIIEELRLANPDNQFLTYQAKTAGRLVRRLILVDELGAELDARNLEDAGQLLGSRLTNWKECDEALERFVRDAPPSRNAELVRFFHRRVQRQNAILGLVDHEVPDIAI